MMKKVSVLMVLLLVVSFCIAGCGAGEKSPSDTAGSFLEAIKTGDQEMLNKVYEGGDLDLSSVLDEVGEKTETDEDEPMFKALMEKMKDFDYEIVDEKVDGDKAIVEVKIKTYQFGTAATEFFSDYMSQALALAFSDASEEKMTKLAEKIFTEKMNALEEKSYEGTAKLILKHKEDGWVVSKLDEDNEMINVLAGNLIDTLASFEDIYSDGE